MIIYRTLVRVSIVLALICFTASAGAAGTEKVRHHGELVEPVNSILCISCHDGTIGHAVRFCTTKCDVAKEHTVFRPYPPRGKEAEFQPIHAVRAKGIVIENGKVVCVSCHNIRNQDRFHLVMTTKNSQLCLSCHIR